MQGADAKFLLGKTFPYSMKLAIKIQGHKECEYLDIFSMRFLQNVHKEEWRGGNDVQTGFIPLFLLWNTQALY